jgi:Beta-1,3-glucanase
MQSDRRSFLASLGAAGALAACSGGNVLSGAGSAVSQSSRLWHPSGKGSAGVLPIEIINNTGFPDSEIFFVTTGQLQPDMPAAKKFYPWYHLTDSKGTLAEIVPSDVKGGKLDYSLNLATDTEGGKLMLPALDGGGRMYFSIKNKLNMTLATILNSPYYNNTTPNGWSTGADNYGTLFDWWEFVNLPTVATTGFNANLTQVDMVGIPMALTAFGADTPAAGNTTGFKAGARSKILATMKKTKGWEKLVIEKGGQDVVVIAPFHGIENGTFDSTYFDSYVDAVWAFYAATGTNKLTAEVQAGITFEGQVNAMQKFYFTKEGAQTAVFAKPTTFEVLANQINALSGGVHGSEIQGALAPAINRTVLLSQNDLGIITGTSACTSALKNSYTPWKGITNWYAKVVHDNAIDGLAYALGNDDNCGGSSFTVSRKPTKATITLEGF